MAEMKKLGKYSGTVYDFYDENIPECCSTIDAKLEEDKIRSMFRYNIRRI